MVTRQSMLARIKRIPPALIAYATVLVAFFLRVYRLGDKNVWWDEGWSFWLGQKDLAWIALRTAADEHPPLHYWMLHFWDALTGWNAFAGRFLSVLFGVLTVALIYRIGKRVGGAWVGALAALVLALARFHIWWSQDIKNYTPSILFVFAALWFAIILLNKPTRVAIGGYAVCAALALWTHYLAALVLLGLNVYALVTFIRLFRRGAPGTADVAGGGFSKDPRVRLVSAWIIANATGAILFVPWLAVYLQNAATWSAAPTFDFGLFLRLVATVLPLGVTTNIDNYAVLTIALTLLALLGVAWVLMPGAEHRQGTRSSDLAICFLLIVLLPPFLLYILSLTPVSFFAPKIQARYLLVLLPAYAILLALGIAVLRRFSIYAGLAAMLLVVGASAFVLRDYYAERRLTDEYSTLANTVNALARPEDLVLLDTDQEWPTFLYYMRSPLEWLGVPNGQPMSAANAEVFVQRALAKNRAVWVVTIPDALATDPQHLVEARLAREMPVRFEQTLGDKRLALYAPSSRDLTSVPRENFAPQYLRSEQAGASFELLGFDLPVHEARAGDTLRVVTYWNAQQASQVAMALRHAASTNVTVPAGERVRVETDFVIPPDGAGAMPIDLGNVELAQVRVEPRAAPQVVGSISHATNDLLGNGIYLAGYDLPVTPLHAGDPVPLTLYWRADRAVDKNYTVFVHLLGTTFNAAQGNFLWGQIDRVPRDGAYPTTAWTPGEVIPDAYRVPIDGQAPPGDYQIEIGLYDPATGARLAGSGGQDSLIIGEIQIATR